MDEYENKSMINHVIDKLYNLYINGRLDPGPHRWACDWSDRLSNDTNLALCHKEVAALRVLENVKVISFDIIDNYYHDDAEKRQSLKGAARYFDQIPLIMDLNSAELTRYCNLIGHNPHSHNDSLPPVECDLENDFRVHKSNIISYKNKEIILEPQVRNVIALIMRRSKDDHHTTYDNMLDCLVNSRSEQAYADIRRNVSRARAIFKSTTGKDHDFFPNKRGIGYTFNA
jgi:hypothetical protein